MQKCRLFQNNKKNKIQVYKISIFFASIGGNNIYIKIYKTKLIFLWLGNHETKKKIYNFVVNNNNNKKNVFP